MIGLLDCLLMSDQMSDERALLKLIIIMVWTHDWNMQSLTNLVTSIIFLWVAQCVANSNWT